MGVEHQPDFFFGSFVLCVVFFFKRWQATRVQFFIDLLYEIESITSFHRHIDMKFEMRFFLVFSRFFLN